MLGKAPSRRQYFYVGLLEFGAAALALAFSFSVIDTQASGVNIGKSVSEAADVGIDSVRLLLRPGVSYETSTPEELGLDGSKLEALWADLSDDETQAFVVVRNGQIAYERYSQIHGEKRTYSMAAVIKGIGGSIALMAAVEEGLIGLDDPAWHYIPEWGNDPLKSQVKVRQLADHSSGLVNVRFGTGEEFQGWQEVYDSNRGERFSLAITKAPLLFQPGSGVLYSSVAYDALAYALTVSLQDSTRHSDIHQLMKNRIMEPLEIPEASWSLFYGESYEVDGMKMYGIGSGAKYSARAAARVGELLLNGGTWNDRQILSPESVDAITAGASPIPGQPHRPMGWKRNDEGIWPSLPRDAYAAVGAGHKLLLVMPSLDMVVVRLGKSVSQENAEEDLWAVTERKISNPVMGAVVKP